MKVICHNMIPTFRLQKYGARVLLSEFAPLCDPSLLQIFRETIANDFAYCGILVFDFQKVKFFSTPKQQKWTSLEDF